MKLLKFKGRYWKECLYSTAIGLLGTVHFIEAKNAEFGNYILDDLFARAKNILKVQGYLLYQWSLIRFCIKHPVAEKLLPMSFYEITPDYFLPTNEEIIKYLNNPKFMWRFSMRNYGFFSKMFRKHLPFIYHDNDFADGELLTHDEDFSPLVAYVAPLKENMKIKIKNKWNHHKKEVAYDYTFQKIEQIKKYFPYNKIIKDYEVAECFHSADYYLHQMDPKDTSDEFLQILITGYTNKGPCKLVTYRDHDALAKSRRQLKYITKKVKKEAKISGKRRKDHIKSNEPDDAKLISNSIKSPPPNASFYLGVAGTKYDEVRLSHLKYLAEKFDLPSTKNRYCISVKSDWNDAELRSPLNGDTVYRVALETFGHKNTNIRYFVEVDSNGNKSRFGWCPPCDIKQYEALLNKYFPEYDVDDDQHEFLHTPPLIIEDGKLMLLIEWAYRKGKRQNETALLESGEKLKKASHDYSTRHNITPGGSINHTTIRSLLDSNYNTLSLRKKLRGSNRSSNNISSNKENSNNNNTESASETLTRLFNHVEEKGEKSNESHNNITLHLKNENNSNNMDKGIKENIINTDNGLQISNNPISKDNIFLRTQEDIKSGFGLTTEMVGDCIVNRFEYKNPKEGSSNITSSNIIINDIGIHETIEIDNSQLNQMEKIEYLESSSAESSNIVGNENENENDESNKGLTYTGLGDIPMVFIDAEFSHIQDNKCVDKFNNSNGITDNYSGNGAIQMHDTNYNNEWNNKYFNADGTINDNNISNSDDDSAKYFTPLSSLRVDSRHGGFSSFFGLI